MSVPDYCQEMEHLSVNEQLGPIDNNKNKKPYAAFLIDRPFNNNQAQKQREDNSKDTLMNCMRYRLRIVSAQQVETGDKGSTNSSAVKCLYDTLLQLIDEFDATGIAEIFRLLLERRSAIPLFVPQSKKHFMSLFRHITLPKISNYNLGEDKSLMRVAVISCRQKNRSQTCDILKKVFNIDSIHSLDCTKKNTSSETMLAEIGCGCIVTEDSNPDGNRVRNVLVIHVIGDFRPLWSFLRRFADFFLIEDSTVAKESFFTSFMTENQRDIDLKDGEETKVLFNCIWKPCLDDPDERMTDINGFPYLHIEDQLSGETFHKFQSKIIETEVRMKQELFASQSKFALDRLMLCDIPILEAEEYGSLECVSPTEHQSRMRQSVKNLDNLKKNEFLLQKSFMQQAKHEEAKIENRLNEKKVREEDKKIKDIRDLRRAATDKVQKNLLLQLFLNFLENNDPCTRVLSIRMLEKELAKCGEQELGPLLGNISSLTALYYDKLHKQANGKDFESTKQNLLSAKEDLVKSALNMEHLWRELSHLYTDMESKKQSPTIQKIPQLAAQHLMDGFCLELLDGDSNMIHLEWVKQVLSQLEILMKGKRIFVLSVMGIQSSGKSTLLNTMFGIQMRTSVGQCTRGVNMQLLEVKGRPEYDYILLLDTEGTRSPEYHGLPGSEKRDNQMATINILLADATIVVIPGENDAAVKEILPIVLMAYQGSKLAEDNGGRLSSRMFFVYNRIDTQQKNKLNTIIETLGTSLHDAFSKVQKSTGNMTNLMSDSPFANFKLVTSDSSSSDVCILGNVKKQSEPPGDVPDEKYGEELIRFREHIHQRVTNVEGISGKKWKSRSIKEFSSYIENAWKCVCSANFIFSFATVLEHMMFDKLDSEYRKTERKLAEAYEMSFVKVKIEMINSIEHKKSSISFEHFEESLRNELFPIEQGLNKEVDDVLKEKELEKWKLQFENIWKNNKEDQALNWRCNLKNAFDRLFNYENRVEKYQKKMRTKINEFFKSSTESDVSNWTESKKQQIFEDMFENTLDEAKKEFPKRDVPGEIRKVYQNSNVIKQRQIHINWSDKLPVESNPYAMQSYEKKEDKKKGWVPEYFKKKFPNLFKDANEKHAAGAAEEKKQEAIDLCINSVRDTVNRVTAGKLCYDDSIISKVIREVNNTIIKHNLIDNSVVQQMHEYGAVLIVDLMERIEEKWERENSVPAKLESDKDIMRQYFMMVSQGVAKTILFAATMATKLEISIFLAFETQMVQKIFLKIRNERWLHHDARYMQKHMDLHLINLLEDGKLNEALDNIRNPKTFYANVLHRLIAEKVTNVGDEWEEFKKHLGQAIEKAAKVEIDIGKAQTFVDQLRKEFLEGYLQSETLGSAFRMDFSGEYQECDEEERIAFNDACSKKMKEVLEKSVFLQIQGNYAKKLSPKVVQYMITLNDQAALPRCDVSCRMCKSLCIEPANHDTQLRPHDAIHQPSGVAGISRHPSDRLEYSTCSQCFEQDRGFYLNEDYTTLYKYRDYDKVFPEWKNPKLQEELPVREYILATYNEKIAEKYNVKPADDIPASYFRDLKSIKKQLENDIQIGSGDTNNQSE